MGKGIIISSTKAEWLEFVDKISAGNILGTLVLNVKDKKVLVQEIAQDNTATLMGSWTPKVVDGAGKVAISPDKIKKALEALPDVGLIGANFAEDNTITFTGAKRYVKFKMPEIPEQKDFSKMPKFDKFLVELEIDAKVIEQILSKATSAIEQEAPRYELIFDNSVLSVKIGDFASDGNEMGFPLSSSLAGGAGDEKFSSSFNDSLREVMKIGGKMKISLGKNYPIKMVSVGQTMTVEYILAPALPREG